MQGIITKTTGSWYTVKYETIRINCKLRGKFKLKDEKTTNPIAIGDIVSFEKQKDGIGVINDILPRKNFIVRKPTNLSRQKHIIAANIDQAILMVTLIMPETPLEFIDRFLVTAEIYKIPAIILFNKIDIYTKELSEYMHEIMHEYEKIGYKSYEISATEKINLETLKEILKNKTSLISGNSGVGKSTLINKLDPSLNLRTDEISDYHLTGKHTTTFAEMFELQSGGFIIDTPGIKGFGTVDMSQEDVAHNFPEIFKLLPQCKFYNCTHTHEPKCAVKEALEKNEIPWWRYRSYLSLIEDDTDKYRKDAFR